MSGYRYEALAPDGFSLYRNKKEIRAASPDEVLFRVRAVRHKPKAAVAFWREGVRVRMEEAA